LSGERLEQRDLSFSEELRFLSAERNYTTRNALAYQGDANKGAKAPLSGVFASVGKFVILGLHVSNMDSLLIESRSASNVPTD
jgi:hypothetical protein